MSQPYVGEIRMFAGNFEPVGWAFCDGRLLAIATYDTLFSLFGTTYGGDGRQTFGVPDLRGRIPIHAGQGPGLSNRRLGQQGGAEKVTVTNAQLPVHRHNWQATTAAANALTPEGNLLGQTQPDVYVNDIDNAARNLNAQAVGNVGGSQSHDNVMPFLCITFIVSLYGIYPSRH